MVNNRIIICKNSDNNGTKIIARIGVFTRRNNIDGVEEGPCYNLDQFINAKNSMDKKFSNRVILSGVVKIDNDSAESNPVTLLTQQNLEHNIKFIHFKNDFNKPRILFMKNIDDKDDDDKQYLFNKLSGDNSELFFTFQGINKTIKSNVNFSNTDNATLIYYYNYYKRYYKSDYYKIKFSDFITLSDIGIGEPDSMNIKVKDISVSNEFLDNSFINYTDDNSNNFTELFQHTDTDEDSITRLNLDGVIDKNVNDNILIYNQLNNLTTIDLNYNINESITTGVYQNDISINFFIQKITDFEDEKLGKILLNRDFTYLNTTIIDEQSDFYNNPSNIDFKNLHDSSGMIFLSLGQGITGFTQEDLFTRTKIIFNNPRIPTHTTHILFTDSNNLNITHDREEKKYLLEGSYNYDYINTTFVTFQEPRNLNNVSIKKSELSLLNYFQPFSNEEYSDSELSNNIYYNRFNNLELLNNSIDNNHYEYDNSYNESNIFFVATDSSYNIERKLKVDNEYSDNYGSIEELKNKEITDKLYYDFRFNYGEKFDLQLLLDAKYNFLPGDPSYNELSDYSDNLLLNFHKIVLTNYFVTTTGSDFTNIDCIFVYHDPIHTNDPSYQYPNDNIEIIRNPDIDNLSKAIELLPGAETSTTNSVFIPARNSSNLSRKHIQGLVGLGKESIPKLLSIQPKDNDKFIEGRGFIRQFRIEDTCKTETDIVNDKLEAQKHSSAKTVIVTNRRQNFANLVRSGARNRGPLPVTPCPNETESIKANNYYTPFRMFKTGKGNYLRSGR